MRRFNNKGAFSIIAALLVAAVLITTVIATYSALRYSPIQEQPQILSAIDETNLGIKQMLGFTVGYYGSVLKVTGNVTYAQQLAKTYLNSSLQNMAEIRPEWGASFKINSLDLKVDWFTNDSFSQGNLNVNYDLSGLGIWGITYSDSTRLEVEISKAASPNQAEMTILRDNGEPLINLGKNNLQFYQYLFGNSTWNMIQPTSITSYADGSYIIDMPPGVSAESYGIQVSDTRGIMVVATSYNQFSSAVTWNSSSVDPTIHYVDNANLNVLGTHSNFAAQQQGPDGTSDTLTEDPTLGSLSYYPINCNLLGSTTIAQSSGNVTADTDSNDGNYLQLHAYPTAFSATTDIFGYAIPAGTSTALSNVKGSRFTTTTGGLANSITAYLDYTPPTTNLGNTATGTNDNSIMNSIQGRIITTPASQVTVQTITAYLECTTSAKPMKAAIYNGGTLIAQTSEYLVPVFGGRSWVTFTFDSPITLAASTNYAIVVWSTSSSGTGNLESSGNSNNVGRSVSSTYGTSFPSSVTFTTSNVNYCIYATYIPAVGPNAKCAIYSSNGGSRLGVTDEVTLNPSTGSWVTFPFSTKPILNSTTSYVLVVWTSDTSNVNVYYNSNTAERFEGTGTYPTWPASVTDQSSQRIYSIYCNYSVASQYTAQAELTGASDSLIWQQLTWSLDGSVSAGTANCTLQLYDFANTRYPLSGNGFLNTPALGTTDSAQTQVVLSNPANFRGGGTSWKIMLTAVSNTATPFDFKVDLANFTSQFTDYVLNLQEQFLNVNATNLRQDLCIKTGAFSGEPLVVQVLHGGSWQYLTTLAPNYFNNASLAPYIDSSTLAIRFVGYNDLTDQVIDNWNVDSVYIKNEQDIHFLVNLQSSTFTLEVLQNGTIRWLGQNMQNSTQSFPIPPLPVKSLHVNETVNGVNSEVPFQIEDWASDYQIPLGMTNNATVFSNRQMIVFLVNNSVSDFTVWWNGNDNASQTSLAYTNRYFSENVNSYLLSNSKMSLQFSSNGFNLQSTVGTVTTTANLMRVNNVLDTTASLISFPLVNGVVRDIVLGEAEFSGGILTCPNFYANIVITMPANVDYYTYQLHIMFINSTQARALSDLCPISISTSVSGAQIQTENGVLGGMPNVQNGTGTFSNVPSYSAHHFSQFITVNGKGSGIMFTEKDNQRLYAFDSFAASTSKGAVRTSSGLIELVPVSSPQVQFLSTYDITWQGAVVTFDNTIPVCGMYDDTTPYGLWIAAEYPPTLTVTAKS